MIMTLYIPERGRKPTNGDVIKAIFPKAKVWKSSGKICVDGHGCFKTFSIDWWNAPYKAETEVKSDAASEYDLL